jgi:hypothetical protein
MGSTIAFGFQGPFLMAKARGHSGPVGWTLSSPPKVTIERLENPRTQSGLNALLIHSSRSMPPS